MSFLTGNFTTNLRAAQTGAAGNGGSITYELIAPGAFSSPRVIAVGAANIELADKDTLTQQDKILGISTTSTSAAGQLLAILSEGYWTDPSFTFTRGPIWLGNAGVLTQVKPTTGILLQVATAISATEIYVDLGVPIKLA